jgi:hypothetical protein
MWARSLLPITADAPVMPSRPNRLPSVRDHRGQATFDKVNLLDPFIAGRKHLANGEINGHKMRPQQAEVCAR